MKCNDFFWGRDVDNIGDQCPSVIITVHVLSVCSNYRWEWNLECRDVLYTVFYVSLMLPSEVKLRLVVCIGKQLWCVCYCEFCHTNIKQNLKHIHTTTVTTYLNSRKINKLLHTAAPTINTIEATLTKAQRRTLAQLRNK